MIFNISTLFKYEADIIRFLNLDKSKQLLKENNVQKLYSEWFYFLFDLIHNSKNLISVSLTFFLLEHGIPVLEYINFKDRMFEEIYYDYELIITKLAQITGDSYPTDFSELPSSYKVRILNICNNYEEIFKNMGRYQVALMSKNFLY